MTPLEIQSALIPKLAAFAGVPVFEADQDEDTPDGPHAVFKFTTPYTKDIGGANVTTEQTADGFLKRFVEDYKMTISFSAIAMDVDLSRDTAQKIRDWFSFVGEPDIEDAGVSVVSLGDVANRDAFQVDGYERRNGFDVILRASRELIRETGIIETADITQE